MTLFETVALSPTECNQLVLDSRHCECREGLVFNMAGLGAVNKSHYRAQERFIPPDRQFSWLYCRLGELLADAANNLGLPDVHVREMPRLLSYGEGGHFGWHVDGAPGRAGGRLLTLSIQLSEPLAYEGGELQVRSGDSVTPASKVRGMATAFQACQWHRVSPVDQGRRLALVAWGYGQ